MMHLTLPLGSACSSAIVPPYRCPFWFLCLVLLLPPNPGSTWRMETEFWMANAVAVTSFTSFRKEASCDHTQKDTSSEFKKKHAVGSKQPGTGAEFKALKVYCVLILHQNPIYQ
uniref:Secreted protein n=1 Tax=Micrurus lemniscatus lemniscatus TaxID=129467 RepID=A0A2D4H1P2_MICLE